MAYGLIGLLYGYQCRIWTDCVIAGISVMAYGLIGLLYGYRCRIWTDCIIVGISV